MIRKVLFAALTAASFSAVADAGDVTVTTAFEHRVLQDNGTQFIGWGGSGFKQRITQDVFIVGVDKQITEEFSVGLKTEQSVLTDRVKDESGASGINFTQGYGLSVYQAHVKYNLPTLFRVQPYVIGGVGMVNFTGWNTPYYTAGVGGNFSLTNKLSVNLQSLFRSAFGPSDTGWGLNRDLFARSTQNTVGVNYDVTRNWTAGVSYTHENGVLDWHTVGAKLAYRF